MRKKVESQRVVYRDSLSGLFFSPPRETSGARKREREGGWLQRKWEERRAHRQRERERGVYVWLLRVGKNQNQNKQASRQRMNE